MTQADDKEALALLVVVLSGRMIGADSSDGTRLIRAAWLRWRVWRVASIWVVCVCAEWRSFKVCVEVAPWGAGAWTWWWPEFWSSVVTGFECYGFGRVGFFFSIFFRGLFLNFWCSVVLSSLVVVVVVVRAACSLWIEKFRCSLFLERFPSPFCDVWDDCSFSSPFSPNYLLLIGFSLCFFCLCCSTCFLSPSPCPFVLWLWGLYKEMMNEQEGQQCFGDECDKGSLWRWWIQLRFFYKGEGF